MIKKLFALSILALATAAGCEIGSRFSTDALSLALGVMFGVMAAIPAALIAVAGNRDRRNVQQPREPSRIAEASLLPVVRPTNYWLVSEELEVRK